MRLVPAHIAARAPSDLEPEARRRARHLIALALEAMAESIAARAAGREIVAVHAHGGRAVCVSRSATRRAGGAA